MESGRTELPRLFQAPKPYRRNAACDTLLSAAPAHRTPTIGSAARAALSGRRRPLQARSRLKKRSERETGALKPEGGRDPELRPPASARPATDEGSRALHHIGGARASARGGAGSRSAAVTGPDLAGNNRTLSNNEPRFRRPVPLLPERRLRQGHQLPVPPRPPRGAGKHLQILAAGCGILRVARRRRGAAASASRRPAPRRPARAASTWSGTTAVACRRAAAVVGGARPSETAAATRSSRLAPLTSLKPPCLPMNRRPPQAAARTAMAAATTTPCPIG